MGGSQGATRGPVGSGKREREGRQGPVRGNVKGGGSGWGRARRNRRVDRGLEGGDGSGWVMGNEKSGVK